MKKQLLMIIFLLVNGQLLGDNFYFSFNSEYFHDNNIFEQIDSPIIKSNLVQNSIASGYYNKLSKITFCVRYNGNYQKYFEYNDENKLYQKINSEFHRVISTKNTFYIKSYLSQKNWIKLGKFYNNSYFDIGMLTKNGSFKNYTEIYYSRAIYSFFSEYDYRDFGIRNIVLKKITPGFSVNGKFDVKVVDYLNNFIHKKRFDRNFIFDIGFEYQKNMIFGADFIVNYLESNYNFLANYSFTFAPYLSAEFHGFYYQVIARWNIRRYKHIISLNDVNISIPDPEENTNNQIFFGFERNIYKELYITGKMIYFSSEYKYQSDYYEKFMAGIGVKVKL